MTNQTNNMAITLPLEVDVFKKLFVNREDIYSVQDNKGAAYHKVNRPLTKQLLKDHMLGKQTIGLYQLKNNTVKWALIDIDINKEVWSKPGFKIEDWADKVQEQSRIVKEILSNRGMVGYRENSGFKGEHVWVFFDKPMSAELVKNVFDSLFKEMEMVDEDMHIEIFPKQSHATDTGPGSLVKAPLGKHQRSGKYSSFIDKVDNLELCTLEKLKGAANEFDAIFQGCSALRELRDESIHSEHLGNEERLWLAYIFANLGDPGLEYIEKHVFSKLSDYDPVKTKYHLEMVRAKYKPVTCKTLQDRGVCPGPCTQIGNKKSPIAFYYRQIGQKDENEDLKSTSALDHFVMNGHNYYEYKGESKIPELLSNFTLNLYEQLYIDNGKEIKTVYRGHVINEDGVHEIEMKNEDYTSDQKFSAAIYGVLGNSGTYISDPEKIRHTSNKYSKQNKITIKKIFGYNEDYTKYYSPSVMVTAEEVKPNDQLIINLDGEGQSELLDLQILTDTKYNEIVEHIKEDLLGLADSNVTHTAFAHAMLPIIEPFVDKDDKSKYAFFLRGQSGTGKSFLMKAMQNFYGFFPEDVATWGSTPYSLQRLGYFFKDTMFLVDDFKLANITNHTAMLQVLQNYSDTTARARLASDGGSMGASWVIRGTLAITGEDTISGEASNIARMITVEYPSSKRDLDRGDKVKRQKEYYSGFTARYISHIIGSDKDEISDTRQMYLKEFFKVVEGQANDVRIARNIAILMTSYHYLASFLWNKKEAEENIAKIKEFLKSLLVDVMDSTLAEKSSHRFWEYLQEFIAADKLQIATDAGQFNPANNSRGAIVGFKSGGATWLIKNIAYNEVQKLLKQSGEPLKHGLKSIMHDLEMDGIIKSAATETRKFNGRSVRAIQVEFDKLDLVDAD